MRFDSVTFDLDGTMLDTVADLAEACRLMLEDVGASPRSLAEIHSFVGKGMAILVERCLTREHPPTAEQMHAAIEAFRHNYTETGMFTEALLERMGMSDYFDVIVSGDTTANKKPHPEPILHACEIFGVRPDRNLHIGDSKHDIHAAHAAGCQAYCVPYGYNEGQPVSAAECDELVPDLLAAFNLVRADQPKA